MTFNLVVLPETVNVAGAVLPTTKFAVPRDPLDTRVVPPLAVNEPAKLLLPTKVRLPLPSLVTAPDAVVVSPPAKVNPPAPGTLRVSVFVPPQDSGLSIVMTELEFW